MTEDGKPADFIEIGPGIYEDAREDKVIFLKMSEVMAYRDLPDTHDWRLSVYNSMKTSLEAAGYTVLLIEEHDVDGALDIAPDP